MSMYKKLIGSLTISLLFLLSATPSFAQQNDVKVTGKITDGSGAPLAGVVVVVKDGKSNNGAVSNTQGVYEIKVPASSTLLFTCLGYTDQEVKLGASNVVNVTMTEDAQSLDEVVVVGYGTQKKKDLTGGLAVVSKQTLEMVSTNNLMDRLVGQVAGLNITTGNEAPGSNQTLLIRRPELTDGQQRPADHSRRHSLLGRTGRPRPEHHREHVGAERRVGRGHLRFARLERRHPDPDQAGFAG